MSTRTVQNAIGAALVLIVVGAGGAFGFLVLGGNSKSPANAETPTSSATPVVEPTGSSCLLCLSRSDSRSRSGGVGVVPRLAEGDHLPMPGGVGAGGGGTGGTALHR